MGRGTGRAGRGRRARGKVYKDAVEIGPVTRMVEKKMKKTLKWVGPGAYVLGLVVAIAAGIMMPSDPNIMTLLAALGVIVGLVNIKDKEKTKFLLASLTFLTVAMSLSMITQSIPEIGDKILQVVYYVMFFTAPAAAVVSLIVINEIAKGR